MVGQIGRGAEAKAENLRVPVQHFYRLEARAKEFKSAGDVLQFHLRQAAEFVVAFENVAKRVANLGGGIRVGIQGDLVRLKITERAHIVEAEDVIRMRVRIQHGVEPANLLADGLL